MEPWDTIVVGAGPAGLMAALTAAERGLRTLLLEKNAKPGAKILMSGGTRCNLTHAADARAIAEAFGPSGRFLLSALHGFSPQSLVDFFEAAGVATKVELGGKVFPTSDRAADVADALLRRLRQSGCMLALGEPVAQLAAEEGRFRLTTSQRTVVAGKLVLATGGQSYPGCGTTGDGYAWAAALGHTIVPPRPALVPLVSELAWVRLLQGITVPDVSVEVLDADNQRLARRRGSLLFTHFGLSGPAAMDVSRAVTGHARPRTLRLVCDFLPSQSRDELAALLAGQSAAAGKRQIAGLLDGLLPHRLVEALLELAGVPADRRGAEFSAQERRRVVDAVKAAAIAVSGSRGFAKAEVTAGGVALDEVDSRTLQSKLVPGLYIVGELLDVDGPIGGYNFQAAFSTGWLAGMSIAE